MPASVTSRCLVLLSKIITVVRILKGRSCTGNLHYRKWNKVVYPSLCEPVVLSSLNFNYLIIYFRN